MAFHQFGGDPNRSGQIRTEALVLELLQIVVLELFTAHLDRFFEVVKRVGLWAGRITSAGQRRTKVASRASNTGLWVSEAMQGSERKGAGG